jgi:hypothetical protein
VAKNLAGKLHYHSCSNCRHRYPDACHSSEENGLCNTCRSGRSSIHMVGSQPQDCCRTDCRVANKDDIEMYRLRGTGPWWLCRTCSRQHGFDPRNTHV